MLKLKDFRSTAKGLPDLLPYAALIAPGIVLNKDGSFLAAWGCKGQDTASSTDDELAYVSAQANNALKLLGNGFIVHMDAVRSPHRAYSKPEKSHFPDAVSQMLDDERRAFFSKDTCYTTSQVLCLSYKPNTLSMKVAGRAQNEAYSQHKVLEKGLKTFQHTLQEFEEILSTVLDMERLGEYSEIDEYGREVTYSDLLSHLQHCLTGELHPVRLPDVPMYLDAILGSEELLGGIAPRLGNKNLAVLSIDGLPQESRPAMLAMLDALPLPYRFSSRFICLDQFEAKKEADSYRKGWKQQVHRFIDQFLNNPNARVNRDAAAMVEDAEQGIEDIQSNFVGAGYFSSCIILMHEDAQALAESAREVRRMMQTLGFGCRIETINALEAWLGSHPANGYANLRRAFIHTLNLADLLPLSSVWAGRAFAPCPFYPSDSPPLSVVLTDGATPFWLNLHVGDLGHTFIGGPTGSGKSTLLGHLAWQFRRYANSSVFVFDKGMSMYALCRAVGGTHYNIGNSGQLSFAPLQYIDTKEEMAWAEEWIETLAAMQGLALLPGHRVSVHQAMENLHTNPKEMRSLSDFVNILQDVKLKEALQHYTLKGAMGHLLDARADTLGIDNFMVFEIESLMNMGDKNLIPVLLYLFQRIERALKGQPALLILDEAWVMLGHKVFKEKIREWLKVFRKANCAVVMATQSLSDAADSGIFDVIVQSCPTQIHLANHAARQDSQKALYYKMGLNERQIEIIAAATAKRDYYINTPIGRRLIQLGLGAKELAFTGVSDKENIARIDKLIELHGPEDWQTQWLKERRAV